MVFIKKSGDYIGNLHSWPIIGHAPPIANYAPSDYQGYPFPPDRFGFSTSIIPGGFRFESEAFQMNDLFNEFPSGEYEFIIIGWRGGSSFTFVGGLESYMANNLQSFTLNDICPTCPTLYEGTDDDGDGLLEFYDNCPEHYNPLQENDDDDTIGNVCDNCPNVTNEDQADLDEDGVGNACDLDIDGDGVSNAQDDCPYVAGSSSNNGCPNVDSDNDGVYDHQDNCIDEAGPASNNGCPEDMADLVVNTSSSTALSSGANTSTVSFSSNETHHIYLGQELQINLSIKNQGDAASGYNDVGVYLSSNNSFSSASLIDEITYYSNIDVNESVSKSFALSNSTLSQYANSSGNVYVHFKLDKNDDVDEGDDGGEDNNIYSSVKAKTYYTAGRSFPKKIISLNNFSSTTVNNENEQKAAIAKLGNGLYVIKNSNGGAQKIIKN